MRAVWLVLVAGFRRQWRSWVLLGLLIAVASAGSCSRLPRPGGVPTRPSRAT